MKIVLYLVALFIQHSISAQENNFSIVYKCIFNKNFDRGTSLMTYTANLKIKSEASLFYMIPDNPNDVAGNGLEVSFATDTFLLTAKNIGKDVLIFAEPSLEGTTKYFRDTLHPLQWMLTDERKVIDSLECYKATAIFRGREYSAWYCPAIPVANGPWKLGGLPGLIVEAYDNNKDLYFILTQLAYDKDHSLLVERDYPRNLPDFVGYKKYWTALIRKMDGALAATESNSSCVGCQTKSSSKVYMWEKWTD